MKNKIVQLVKTLQAKGLTLALAESVTCGLAAHKLAGVKGTSNILKGAIVCYTPEVKCSLLRVSQRKIDKYTCESMEVTKDLIKGVKKLIKADVHAAITGLAAPGGSETSAKPVGTIFMAVSFHGKVYFERKLFRGSPLEVRTKATFALYDFIISKTKPYVEEERIL